MCKIDFMPNFKKIFIFTVLFLTFIGGNSYSEVIKKIEIKGNERISSETILIFGDVAIGKNYEISDINNLIKKLYDTTYFSDISVELKNNKLVIESKKVNRFHNNIFRLPILHPGLIVKKKVFKKIGNFHNKLILSDKLWMLKLIKSNFLGKKINNVLVNFKMNGSSSKYIILKEYYYLLKKNKDNFFKIVFILIKLFLVITYYKYIYYVK